MVAASGLPGSELLTAVTFVAILATLLLQAGTTPLVADKLGLLEKEKEQSRKS
jgi:cell volume regulation protein A